jgi:UDP-4-amino-4,6-dideoxy-N-acetyl-beta-L-altrosamine transaminase
MIPYGRQDITQADIDAVVEVLQSDYLTQGPVVPLFEQTIANYCGAQHAVAVNSATSALHIACLALGLGPGDWLWTSPITFVASANCGLYCGAQVDFVDIDPHTLNMCVVRLAEKLALARQHGTLPKVVIPVHFGGQSCDMAAIGSLSKQYGFRIIEDASHAIGAKYQKKPVGSCDCSDITIFSFHPVKIITTGEGGMAVTNDEYLASRLKLLRSHGITRDASEMTTEAEGPWYYQQIALGYNYRMTELQAALGLSQASRLDEYVKKRVALAARYDEKLASLPVETQIQRDGNLSASHLYVIRLNLEKINLTKRQVFESLRSNGIGVNVHYIPVYMQPFFRGMGFLENDFPVANDYYERAISLPLFPLLSESQQDLVIETLAKVLE